MKELFKQLLKIWTKTKPKQKLVATVVLLSLLLIFSVTLTRSSSNSFVLLYPNLSPVEEGEVVAFLDGMSIPYKDKQGICVPADQAERIRFDLSTSGLGGKENGKGFELFDTNTWIKGEKELQVLEMRALKGQLEKDLAGFENIKSASVILDIAPIRAFGGQQLQTKASVIITVMHGARLGESQLKAITYHLAGAVRGLEPANIAISDTKGRLYQASGESTVILEEQIRDQIESLCLKVFGKEHYHASIQLLNGKVFIALLIDKLLADLPFEKEMKHQLEAIGRGYGVEFETVVDFVPFEKKRSTWVESKEQGGKFNFVLFSALVLLALLLPLFYYFRKRNEQPDETLLKEMMTKIDVQKLADSVKGEDPQTIAIMLSYLEPHRAEEILIHFPDPFQEEVLAHLENEA
ncbi:MAG: hypothetical protein S4CHLAM45_01420 [Chlamydiales bacterium]|nr:hypothetical protein [Chlamydiales bacterium]MCH9619462.1 hypothetical protein [Chlamydiales bacterium]MCH9622266.1 hypothetical protein [Chlamydiales bacterium]